MANPYASALSGIAGGTIRVCRFVKWSTTEDRTILECDAGDKMIGISQESIHDHPQFGVVDDVAAADGDQFTYYPPESTDVLIRLGSGGCSPGDLLAADADGNGVVATTGDWIGAEVAETADEGHLVRCKVVEPSVAD